MYKYNYLFDADQSRTFEGSRNLVDVEMAIRLSNKPENYTVDTFADALRKKMLEINEERRKMLERFFAKRGTNPIQEVVPEYAD